MKRGERGLTLLELLIALAVVGVLMGIATPAVDRWVQETRATTGTNMMIGSLQFARSESLRVGVPVSLCPSRDGRHCAADQQAWSEGWLIYRHQQSHGNNRLSHPDQILRVQSAGVPGLRANRQRFTMRTDGRRSTNGSILVCREGEALAARAIIINVNGRARSTRDPQRMPSPEC